MDSAPSQAIIAANLKMASSSSVAGQPKEDQSFWDLEFGTPPPPDTPPLPQRSPIYDRDPTIYDSDDEWFLGDRLKIRPEHEHTPQRGCPHCHKCPCDFAARSYLFFHSLPATVKECKSNGSNQCTNGRAAKCRYSAYQLYFRMSHFDPMPTSIPKCWLEGIRNWFPDSRGFYHTDIPSLRSKIIMNECGNAFRKVDKAGKVVMATLEQAKKATIAADQAMKSCLRAARWLHSLDDTDLDEFDDSLEQSDAKNFEHLKLGN